MSGGNNQSVNDFLLNLLNNPISSPANSSSNPQTSNPSPSNTGAPSGFAPFNVNPYSQPFYQQTGFSPVAPHFQQQQYYQQFQQQYMSEEPVGTQVPETPPHHQSDVASTEVHVEADSPNKGKRKQIKWTDDETVILAERWVDASENPIQGNSQTDESFWKTIGKAFNSLVEEKRSKNQLTGKWNKIRYDVKSFGGILKKYTDQRQSGADEKAVYDAAKAHFKQQFGRHFIYEGCYHVLKDCPKFWTDYGVASNKRAIRDEPPLNLEEDEAPPGYPTPNPRMEALFRDDPIRRPPGRSDSRKSQKSRSSSDATSSRHSSEDCKAEYVETQRAHQRALKTIEETARDAARRNEVFEAFRIINLPIDDGLPEREKRKMIKYKNKLLKKYEHEFNDMSDEDEDED